MSFHVCPSAASVRVPRFCVSVRDRTVALYLVLRSRVDTWQKRWLGIDITKHVAGEVQEKNTIPVEITTNNWHSSRTCKSRLQ